MECGTDALGYNAIVEKVATPLVRVPLPKKLAPSKKRTVPVGVPEPGEFAVTVAVNVTESPKFEGFNEEARLTDV